ncbi:hypothetical protein GCM10009422_23660 [Brevundimonas kwangchunensis]|uniref:Phytanoyl-CoA dioxygenase n=1 Tax=Brevundimonas kwangchunensis TaxID=322163 RepID=A0ABP3S523_9CAUL
METGRTAFEREGAAHFPHVLSSDDVERLRLLADESLGDRPGVRLSGDQWLADLLTTGTPCRVAASLTSDAARPVRAVMFDKSPEANWSVAWHQDRTIPVKARVDAAGFGPWSTKDGVLHVAPPFEILTRMTTLRLHLDNVDEANAPLWIAVGTHCIGRIAASAATGEAGRAEQRLCLAETGDIWAYGTSILHASDRASGQRCRRVLQVDYADFELPGGLEWKGF